MNKRKISMILLTFCAVIFAGCAGQVKKGTELLENGQYEKAVETFAEAIKSDKNLAEAYRGQGIAYWELKEYEKSKEALENALENGTKGTALLYQILGDCDMALENYEEALSYYWKGMSADGLNEKQLKEMSYNEIIAYERLKDWKSAKVKMEIYTQKYPDDTEAAKEAEFLETR